MKKIKITQLFAIILCVVLFTTACGLPSRNEASHVTKQATEFNNEKYNTTENFLPFYCWGYPVRFSKQRAEVFKLFAEIDDGSGAWSATPGVIKVKSKIGVKHSFIEFIVEDAASDDDIFYYFGESKDGVPDGIGILFDTARYDHPVFGGTFDNGRVKGYGIIFDTVTGEIVFESEKCEYKGDGEFLANGMSIQYDNTWYSDNFNDMHIQAFNEAGYNASDNIPSVLSIPPSVIYEGEMKESESSGKGQLYYSIYRSGALSTEEILYGPIEYDGDWKYDTFNGDGKYYKQDGSLEYEGQFRDGRIKN